MHPMYASSTGRRLIHMAGPSGRKVTDLTHMRVHCCRADQHVPSYAKKLVAMYNQKGEIDELLAKR